MCALNNTFLEVNELEATVTIPNRRSPSTEGGRPLKGSLEHTHNTTSLFQFYDL